MYCVSSYLQHGGNAVMLLIDLALNRIPVLFLWGKAWFTLWVSLFGLWSGLFFYKTGYFIYPFLDVRNNTAWMMYLGIFVVNWVLFMLFAGLIRGKLLVVGGEGGGGRGGRGEGAQRQRQQGVGGLGRTITHITTSTRRRSLRVAERQEKSAISGGSSSSGERTSRWTRNRQSS